MRNEERGGHAEAEGEGDCERAGWEAEDGELWEEGDWEREEGGMRPEREAAGEGEGVGAAGERGSFFSLPEKEDSLSEVEEVPEESLTSKGDLEIWRVWMRKWEALESSSGAESSKLISGWESDSRAGGGTERASSRNREMSSLGRSRLDMNPWAPAFFMDSRSERMSSSEGWMMRGCERSRATNEDSPG